eukprot:TRINITY_DN2654_c0_g1_i1.p1 TRINITY_DN2654_c0_g1~~TRINITY_DN2654_c0_g1_i1.p1  ORF type:complete len:371 (+),score=41.77 TRINITY_DN2654_c0_g1_i1:47-1159(+)
MLCEARFDVQVAATRPVFRFTSRRTRLSRRNFQCFSKKLVEDDKRTLTAPVKWELQETRETGGESGAPSWSSFCGITAGSWGGKFANYNPTNGEISPVQLNQWKEMVFELPSVTVEEGLEDGSGILRINITGSVDDARWRSRGEEETFREEKLLQQDEVVTFANGSYCIAPNLSSQTQDDKDVEEESKEQQQVVNIIEHAVNMENQQRVRFQFTVIFEKPNIEVVGIGVYKEKALTEKEQVTIFNPAWCVNDQARILKEKYTTETWETTKTEVSAKGEYKQEKGLYSIKYESEQELTEDSGATFWLPNHSQITFEQQDGITTISTAVLDTRKNIQHVLQSRYDQEGNKVGTRFLKAVSTVRPEEGFVLRF